MKELVGKEQNLFRTFEQQDSKEKEREWEVVEEFKNYFSFLHHFYNELLVPNSLIQGDLALPCQRARIAALLLNTHPLSVAHGCFAAVVSLWRVPSGADIYGCWLQNGQCMLTAAEWAVYADGCGRVFVVAFFAVCALISRFDAAAALIVAADFNFLNKMNTSYTEACNSSNITI